MRESDHRAMLALEVARRFHVETGLGQDAALRIAHGNDRRAGVLE